MFKQGYTPDNLVNNQMAPTAAATASIPMPPPNTLNMQFNMGPPPGFSTFTPDYHQFPYTFSSATPPMYSWANTNSTDVMKFTGSSNPQPLDTSTYRPSNFGMVPKRKIDLDAELPQPPKMLITEEKVSASLRDMHISNEFTSHNHYFNNNVNNMDTMENLNLMNTINTNETTKTEAQTTLVMCEELRKLNKIDSIIPQPLLNIERPTKAVVLWQPQPLQQFIQPYSNYKKSNSSVVITEITDDEEIDNNQEEMLIEDNNCIAFEDEMEL